MKRRRSDRDALVGILFFFAPGCAVGIAAPQATDRGDDAGQPAIAGPVGSDAALVLLPDGASVDTGPVLEDVVSAGGDAAGAEEGGAAVADAGVDACGWPSCDGGGVSDSDNLPCSPATCPVGCCLGGDAGGAGSTCGPACASAGGCCDSDGGCQPGISDTACGTGAIECRDCTALAQTCACDGYGCFCR
jgi:hypothetical protein